MPLAQLYSATPLESYGKLPYGLVQGMGAEGYQQALGRQREFEQAYSDYNQQVINEANPALIESQRLTNKQQQYMMPTYEAQGVAAQTKLKTPGYFDAATQAELTGFGKTSAENKLATETATGQLGTAQNIARNASETQNMVTALQRLYTAVTSPHLTEQELVGGVEKLAPRLLPWVKQSIATAGLAKTQELVSQMVYKQQEQLALSDPKHIQGRALEGVKVAGHNIDPVALARAAAISKLGKNASEYDIARETFSLLALRTPAGQPITSEKQTRIVQNNDGTVSFVEETVKTPGNQPAAGTAQPAAAAQVKVPAGWVVIGKAPPGTPDGKRTVNGVDVIVYKGDVYKAK